jgi:hypothetical protein
MVRTGCKGKEGCCSLAGVLRETTVEVALAVGLVVDRIRPGEECDEAISAQLERASKPTTRSSTIYQGTKMVGPTDGHTSPTADPPIRQRG